jgi:predicted Na+-dependent transporter
MNQLKKILGLVWMLLGPVTIYFLISTAISEIKAKPVIDTQIQWGIFIFVFIPISLGLMIFGYFAWTKEYDN